MRRFAYAWMMTLVATGAALWLGCGDGDPMPGSTFPPTSASTGGTGGSGGGGEGGAGGSGGDADGGACAPGTACEDAGICGVSGVCEQRCETSPECQSIVPPLCGHYTCVEGGCHLGFAENGALCPLDDGGNGTCYGGLCVPQHE